MRKDNFVVFVASIFLKFPDEENDYDVWVDFTTGGTVVSLRPVLQTTPDS